MKLTDLKKQLNSLEKNELIALISKLYKGSKQAQDIIDIELCGDSAEDQLVSDCKKKIHASFFGSLLSLKTARKVISDFKKASKCKENIVELMLFYVECGVEFTNVYGDVNEAFYYSIASMFSDFVRALNNLESENYYKRNAERIKKMCQNTNCVGWGFSEEMMSIYSEIQWCVEEE